MLASLLFLLLSLPPAAAVQGTVHSADTGAPVPRALVSIPALRREVTADREGRFVIRDVPEGRWLVQAQALGYRTHAVTLQVPAEGTLHVEFDLEPRPIELPGLEVLTTRAGAVPPPRALFEREVTPGVVGISQRDIREMPAMAEPDVLRSLQALPGVVTLNDLSAQLNVRGGGPDQNLFLLDGARIFAPYHVFGLFGAFNADAVQGVEFFRGALPARYGGALSSVVRVEQRDGPAADSSTFDGGLGFLAARLTGSGTLPWAKGRWMLAGRRSHVDLVAKDLFGWDVPYAFDDLQGRLSLSPARGQNLQASFFTSADRFRMFLGGGSDYLHSRWSNDAGSLRWRWSGSGPWTARATAWGSRYHGRLAAGDGPQAPVTDNHVTAGGVRIELARQGEETGLRAGVDLEGGRVAINGSEEPGGFVTGSTEASYTLPAAYVEAERWVGRLRLAPGLRAAYDGRNGEWLLEPRLAGRFYFTDDLSLTAGVGRSHQILSTLRDDRNVLPGAPFWMVHPDGAPASQTDGADLALEGWLGRAWSVQAAVYARRFRDVPRWRPVGTRELTGLAYDDGSTAGVELSVRRHAGRLTGWASYSFARTSMTEAGTGREYAAAWDRRHTFDAAIFARLWKNLSISTRFDYGSGLPFSPFVGKVGMPRFYPLAGTTLRREFVPLWADQQMRYPDHIRLDVGVRYHFHVRRTQLTPYLNVLNVTRRANVLYYQINSSAVFDPAPGESFESGEAILHPVGAFPFSFFPSVGVDVRF